MSRLKSMPPLLGAPLPPLLGRAVQPTDAAERSRFRRDNVPGHQFYGTAAWRRLSWEVRQAAAFTCARCGRVEGRAGQTVADHIVPHRGDRRLFFDRGNLQCLCKPCHDGPKQAQERRGG